MGYFANGSEGAIYQARYCKRCVHHYGPVEGPGCPVWGAHLLYAYDECNSDSNAKAMLDMLIPIGKDDLGYLTVNEECTMFVQVDEDEIAALEAVRRTDALYAEAMSSAPQGKPR